MSLVSRLRDRILGRSARRSMVSGPAINIDAELPYLTEQLRTYSAAGLYMRERQLDNFSGETAEMRTAYRRALLAEPAIKAALVGKIAAVQALGLNVKPYDDTPRDRVVADYVKHTLQTCKGGLPSLIDSILTPGLVDGFSVCEKVWRREQRGKWAGKIGLAKLKSKDTRFIQFELDVYRNVTAVLSFRGNAGEPYPPTDFVLFSHLSLFESPFGNSDLRSAYRAAEMIPALLKLRMIFLDKYSGPFLMAEVADPAMVESMKAALAAARAGGFVIRQPGDKIDIADMATRGTGEFLQALKDLREEIATGISGAFLHMMTGDGGSGQRGSASVQQDTVDLFIWLLKVKVDACINEQLVPDIVDVNFGRDTGLPTVSLEAPNPEAIVAELAIDEALDRMGLDLSKKDLYERTGRRPPSGPDDVHRKPPPMVPGGVGGAVLDADDEPKQGHPSQPSKGPPGKPAAFSEWKEGDHPRDEGGKFGSGGNPAPTRPPIPGGPFEGKTIVGRTVGGAAIVTMGNPANLTDTQRKYPHLAHVLNGAKVKDTVGTKVQAKAQVAALRAQGIFSTLFKDPKGGKGAKYLVCVPDDTPRPPVAKMGEWDEAKHKRADDGKFGSGPGKTSSVGGADVRTPGKPPGHEHAPSAEETAARVASTSDDLHGGDLKLKHRIALAVHAVYPKLQAAAIKVGLLVAEYQADVLDTAEDFEKIAYARYTGTRTDAHDPVAQHFGIPFTAVAAVVSRTAGYIAGQVAKRRASTHGEGPDFDSAVDATLELLAARYAALGVDWELPSREEVAQALEAKRG